MKQLIIMSVILSAVIVILADKSGVPVTVATLYSSDGRGVEALPEHGVKPDVSNNKDRTAVHLAVAAGNAGAVRALAAEHADLEVRAPQGVTALMLASGMGETEIVRILLEHGASIRTRDDNGWNALHYAVSNGRENVFKLLLDNGAPVDALGPSGNTPLSYAIMYSHPALGKRRQRSWKNGRPPYGPSSGNDSGCKCPAPRPPSVVRLPEVWYSHGAGTPSLSESGPAPRASVRTKARLLARLTQPMLVP
ncbi:MAG: ankyrin repeat domain-containing protein [bacterium]